MESRAVLEQLGVDVSGYGGNVIPTIYAANFERGTAFFLASGFAMRNQDVVFVGEAPSIALQRVTAALSGLTAMPVRSPPRGPIEPVCGRVRSTTIVFDDAHERQHFILNDKSTG